MKLASYSPGQVVFANPNGTYPKRSTLTRIGDDQFTSRIELVDAMGKKVSARRTGGNCNSCE